MIKRLFTILALCLAPACADAHGPTPQTLSEKITIAAAPDAVWALIKDFEKLQSWNPLVEKSAGNGAGNAPGAEREVHLKTGIIADSIDEYNAAAMTYSYRLIKENIEAFPVSFYQATIAVKPSGAGSEVEWSARFYRADTHNDPPEHLNDQAAADALTKLFKSGLETLKTKAQGKTAAKS